MHSLPPVLRSFAQRLGRAGGFVLLAGALGGCVHSNANEPAAPDPEKVSRAEYDLAQDELHRGRLRSAMGHAQRASQADEGHAEAHLFVAQLYLALCQQEHDCRFEEAEKYARKSLAADPNHRPGKLMLGVILINEKKLDEAIRVLRVLAEDIVYKTPELAWYNLGWAYLEKGEVDQAIDALTRSLALKPSFCLSNFRLGVAYEKRGELGRAEQELTRAVEPNEPACRNLQSAFEARARVRTRLGRRDLAKQDYQTCSQLDATTADGKACANALKEVQ